MDQKESDFLHKIGRTVAKTRMEKEFSQDALALEANVSRRTIFRLEGGEINPRILTLKKIAKALKIDVRDLIK